VLKRLERVTRGSVDCQKHPATEWNARSREVQRMRMEDDRRGDGQEAAQKQWGRKLM
jgi:hypothetical protein